MPEFVCPLCQHTRRSPDGTMRVWHTCPGNGGDPVEMTAGRTYEVYCGNFECPTRRAGRTFAVTAGDLVDGELWLCEECRPGAVVDVETSLV